MVWELHWRISILTISLGVFQKSQANQAGLTCLIFLLPACLALSLACLAALQMLMHFNEVGK